MSAKKEKRQCIQGFNDLLTKYRSWIKINNVCQKFRLSSKGPQKKLNVIEFKST